MSDDASVPTTFCGFVAVLGATNAGKSTLINRLVGHKVSIVSRKAQTTRSRVLGIVQRAHHQIVLVDTPGIFPAKSRLEKAMVRAAWGSIPDTDLTLHLVDCRTGLRDQEIQIQQQLQKYKIPAFLVLNKIDTIPKTALLKIVSDFQQAHPYRDVFMISALKGDHVGLLEKALLEAMPPGPFLFDRDQLSSLPEQLLVAEIVREHLFDRLHQELPYGLMVQPERWRERPDGSTEASLCIHVEKKSHKGIVIGKRGATLKAIGSASRHDASTLLERAVHLKLYVKASPRWKQDTGYYRLWGLDAGG